MRPEHDDFFTYSLDDAPFVIDDGEGTRIYGLRPKALAEVAISPDGACYGFVLAGGFALAGFGVILAGQWFTTANGLTGTMTAHSRVLVVQKIGYTGMDVVGRLEPTGRLKYIDGAMDSILFGPIKKGDPIINALYMTPGIHQTMHTHPSTRVGVIIAGEAQAETRTGVHPLKPGLVFFLPSNGWHKFRTDISGKPLTLFAYHPDSDFGPSDEDHPMLNRTMVGEKSAKDMPEIQTA